nr:hypothetical protein DM860_009049 [Ipomoea trifida]
MRNFLSYFSSYPCVRRLQQFPLTAVGVAERGSELRQRRGDQRIWRGWGGVGVDTATKVLKSPQTLRSAHPGSADVQPPSHPIGGGDLAVEVGDISSLVKLVVGPVENGIKHWQITPGSKYSVVGEIEILTILSVRRSHQLKNKNKTPTTLSISNLD